MFPPSPRLKMIQLHLIAIQFHLQSLEIEKEKMKFSLIMNQVDNLIAIQFDVEFLKITEIFSINLIK